MTFSLWRRRRTPAPLPDSGAACGVPEPFSRSGITFPLTPALSRGERENYRPRYDKSRRAGISSDGPHGTLTPVLSLGERENHRPRYDKSRRAGILSDRRHGTLSPRERAGVRGNRAHAVSTVSGCLKRRTWPSVGLLTAALFAVLWPTGALAGDPSATAGAPTGQVITVPLNYQEAPYGFLFSDPVIKYRAVPFPKEPALARGPITRGVLWFGVSPSNSIAFIWQSGANKLVLDRNRNEDLTDDPGGVFSARVLKAAVSSCISQLFTNVHLTFPASSASPPVLVDLHFFQQANRPRSLLCNAGMRSYWQGKVTVGGHDWQVGMMQNLSDQPGLFAKGQLLLRPWEERNREFDACSDPADTWPVPWEYRNKALKSPDTLAFSPKLFFEGHAWQLDWSVEPLSAQETLALRFTEQQPALGELQITGSFIQRLFLMGEPYTVVLLQPPGSVKVPVGRYSQPNIRLKQGPTAAYFNSLPPSGKGSVPDLKVGGVHPFLAPTEPGQAVVVDEQRPAVLVVGGPVTNFVSAVQEGGSSSSPTD